jgi:TonB family protein
MRRTRGRSLAIVLGLVFSTLAIRADVTIRYKVDSKLADVLPPPIIGQALQQMNSSIPKEAVIQVKGNKGYSNYGAMTYLIDFGKQEITLLDAASKMFTTVPMNDFAEKLGASMAVQTSRGSIKTNFSTRKTGRTDAIQGIAAEESEMVISMDQADPIEPPAASPLIKMAMQVWNAKPEEVLRVRALRQWAGYSTYSNYLMNPVTALQKIFASMPGSTQGFASMMEEKSKGLLLRSHTLVYMHLMSRLDQEHHSRPEFDENAPVFEIKSELVELSAEPVNESVFRLPEGYHAAPAEDLMRSVINPQAVSSPSAPSQGSMPSGRVPQRIRFGGNVQAANLIHKVEPVYPPLAEQNGIEGTVRFRVIIDKDGRISNAQLVSGHAALVEAARDAVSQWVYKPTRLNGRPIDVLTEVDVSFRRH